MWKGTFQFLLGLLAAVHWINGCKTRDETFDLAFKNSNTVVDVSYANKDGLTISISRDGQVLQKIYSDEDLGSSVSQYGSNSKLILEGNGHRIEFNVILDDAHASEIQVIRRSIAARHAIRDCIDFDSGVYWYGGPQQKTQQFWPINQQNFTGDYSYVSKEADSMAVNERYWLNSRGVYIYVDPEAPLFISQTPNTVLCLKTEQKLPYSPRLSTYDFSYRIGVAANAKDAHMMAVDRHLGRPCGHPDERMVQHPIWSTWARYKVDINDSIVRDFAQEIRQRNFKDSQLEIDDDWEICYGALAFRTSKFPNIRQLVSDLKSSEFRVTLWIHPFINKGCEPYYTTAKEMGCLVTNQQGNPDTQWWDSKQNEAAYVDFTKPTCAAWFTQRLEKLKEDTGIDAYKFDAGETTWSPEDPVLQGDQRLSPGLITKSYIDTVQKFGPMVEVRSAERNQNIPIFLRMIDKDSYFDYNNGLISLITTLLQLNMNGYPFVLPDMIGGNGYGVVPSKELFVRWLEANVFMPSLQYSFVPWDYDDETVELAHEFNELHSKYTPQIMEAFKRAVADGTPVNPPIWWIAPNDPVAQSIGDEFLLGESILAAPVWKEGATSRNIYLPEGTWTDGNTGVQYQGPRWVNNYYAPLQILPYFIKQGNKF